MVKKKLLFKTDFIDQLVSDVQFTRIYKLIIKHFVIERQ
jgi:hypothetical protein